MLSISISLVAVFIPILLMGGIVGRLFREFAVTLSRGHRRLAGGLADHHADDVPRMLAPPARGARTAGSTAPASGSSTACSRFYAVTLRLGAAPPARHAAGHAARDRRPERLPVRRSCPRDSSPSRTPAGSSAASRPTRTSRSRPCATRCASSSTLVADRPRGGQRGRLHRRQPEHHEHRPHVRRAQAARGAPDLGRRGHRAAARPRSPAFPGANLFLQAVQDLRIGGRGEQRAVPVHAAEHRPGRAQRLRARRCWPSCASCRGCATSPPTSRTAACRPRWSSTATTASRLGILPKAIDDTLYDAFGQRQVSTIYTRAEPVPRGDGSRAAILAESRRPQDIYVRSATGRQVPLSAITRYAPSTTPLAVNHQGHFPSVTLSFNLAPGMALGDAVDRDPGSSSARSACRPPSTAASRAPPRRSRPRWPPSRC